MEKVSAGARAGLPGWMCLYLYNEAKMHLGPDEVV